MRLTTTLGEVKTMIEIPFAVGVLAGLMMAVSFWFLLSDD